MEKKRSCDASPAEEEHTKKAKSVDPLLITDEEREFLKKHGYLVKLNVVPYSECKAAQDEFEAVLKTLDPGFSRNEFDGAVRCTTPKNSHGIQEMGKLAHLECIKRIRLHPNVAAVWKSLLQTPDISSSWDRVNYLPSFVEKQREKPWHHTDVSPGFSCKEKYIPTQSYVQVSATSNDEIGIATTTDTGSWTPPSPCIVLWEYSNLAHEGYFKQKGLTKLKRKNWHIYEPETIAEWERDGSRYISDKDKKRYFPGEMGPIPIRRLEVRVPRGGMVFWQSATAHMNTSGRRLKDGRVQGSPYNRFVIYTCFCPKSLVTKKDAENFRKAMTQQRATSHWPCIDLTLFAKVPHLYNGDLVKQYKETQERLQVPLLAFDARERQLVPM